MSELFYNLRLIGCVRVIILHESDDRDCKILSAFIITHQFNSHFLFQ